MRAELTKRLDVKRPLYGPGGHDRNTTPEYFGLMGVAHGPLRRRHSGRGRAVPERPPVDPGRFVSLRFAAILWGGSITCRNVGEGKHRVFGTDVTSRDRLRNLGMGMTLGFA